MYVLDHATLYAAIMINLTFDSDSTNFIGVEALD